MERKEYRGRDNREREEEKDKLTEKLISMNRVSKSNKGGRRISFAALMVVGDRAGNVGFGSGKANDVSEAIRKATEKAKENMRPVALKKTTSPDGATVNVTIPYEVTGDYKSASVLLKPARPGTGVIAGGSVRAVCDAAGITDILSKSLGSNSKANVVKATFAGFAALRDPSEVAKGRDKAVKDMWG